MAFTYENTPNLSKVKIGDTVYFLKDSDLRSIVDEFGTIVHSDKTSTITATNEGIPDAKTIHAFVINQIASVGKAVNLRAETDHTEVEEPSLGDLVIEADGSEWLYDGSEWREVGSEGAFVPKTQTIAGIDLQDAITVEELEEALQLGVMAKWDIASVTLPTADSVNPIEAAKPGTYQLDSTGALSVPVAYHPLDITPSGTVAVTQSKFAAVEYERTDSIEVVTATSSAEQQANYTPSGEVTVSNITVVPDKTSVATVTNAGTAYQLTPGSVAMGNKTTENFTTEGLKATIDETDTEMLVFSAASTSAAVTNIEDVSYTPPELSGSLPTFGTESVVGGIANATASAVFTGTGVVISATPTHNAHQASVTQPEYGATFTGAQKNVSLTASTTRNTYQYGNASVTIPTESYTPTLVKTDKTVFVKGSVIQDVEGPGQDVTP